MWGKWVVTEEALEDLREAVTELLVASRAAFDGSPVPGDLSHQVLIGIIAAEYEHVSVINQLSEGLQVRSAEVLLRTLLEGQISRLLSEHEAGKPWRSSDRASGGAVLPPPAPREGGPSVPSVLFASPQRARSSDGL